MKPTSPKHEHMSNPYKLCQEPAEQCKFLLQKYTSQQVAHAGYLITSLITFTTLLVTIDISSNSVLYFFKILFLEIAIIGIIFFTSRQFYYAKLTSTTELFLGGHGGNLLQKLTQSMEKIPIEYYPMAMEQLMISEIHFQTTKQANKPLKITGFTKFLLTIQFIFLEETNRELRKIWTEIRSKQENTSSPR